jgi:hypothetical protein
VGHFDRVEGVTSGRAWLLLPTERTALIGDIEDLNLQTGSAVFNSPDPPSSGTQGAQLTYLCAYWQAYHIWMVIDGGSHWEKIRFRETDALSEAFTADDGRPYRKLSKMRAGECIPHAGQLVAGGWDHEHCELCNTHIDPDDYGYTNVDGLWVCSSCFEKYIGPQDLSFVNEL